MNFTITETRRRLRVAAKLARADSDMGIPSNARIEIGLRSNPMYFVDEVPTRENAFAENDDLDDFVGLNDLNEYVRDEVTRKGYVAHLYFTSAGYYGELLDVKTVWLGDDNHEPIVLH